MISYYWILLQYIKKIMQKNCVFSLFEDYWHKQISNNLSIKKTKLISYTFVRILQYHRHFMANKIILQKKNMKITISFI